MRGFEGDEKVKEGLGGGGVVGGAGGREKGRGREEAKGTDGPFKRRAGPGSESRRKRKGAGWGSKRASWRAAQARAARRGNAGPLPARLGPMRQGATGCPAPTPGGLCVAWGRHPDSLPGRLRSRAGERPVRVSVSSCRAGPEQSQQRGPGWLASAEPGQPRKQEKSEQAIMSSLFRCRATRESVAENKRGG